MTQTTQPVGRFAQARALYGRSTMAQLVIFVGLQFAGSFLMDGVGLILNLLFGTATGAIRGIYTVLNLAVAIGLLFMHRSITFRSADRAVCTALPLAGLVILQALFGDIAGSVLNATGVTLSIANWPYGKTMANVLAVYAGAWLVNILSAVLLVYARAGAVHLARTKGRRALCILPILALAPLAFLNLAATWSMNWSIDGPMWFTLVSIVLSLIMQVVTAVCGYFAQRNLIYRDTCDTAPAARQYILRCMQEVQSAEALVQPRSAGPVQPELTASAKIRVPDTAEGSGKYRTDANDMPGGNA